jgi:hypothetical protein
VDSIRPTPWMMAFSRQCWDQRPDR